METRDRVLGPIAEVTARDESGSPADVAVDFGALLRRLVVSEQLVMQSIGLKELPLLVEKFGYDGVKALLESGRVRLLCQSMFTANIGQYADRTNGPVLPPGSYSFSALRTSPTKEMLSEQLHQIDSVEIAVAPGNGGHVRAAHTDCTSPKGRREGPVPLCSAATPGLSLRGHLAAGRPPLLAFWPSGDLARWLVGWP